MPKVLLTQEVLQARLRYDSESGEFFHLVDSRKRSAGEVAGSAHHKGYIQHSILGGFYKAHRLVWLYVHGKWPDGEIDHINGVRSDNRLCNLRDVSRCVNSGNERRPRQSNKSGLLGVASPCGGDKKFRAVISINGKATVIGRFDNKFDAHEAYLKKKREVHAGCTI